jgi:hypothetical protein
VYAHTRETAATEEKPGMTRDRDRVRARCLLVGLGWATALTAQAAGQCQTFSDPGSFEAFNEQAGWQLLAVEDFEPPVSNLGFAESALLVDPLEGGTPNVDPDSGLGFPTGLAGDTVTVQSSVAPPNASFPAPGSGLAAIGPGFLDPGLPAPGSVMVGADVFDEGTDLFFSADAALTAVGLTLEVAFGGSAEVTVFGVKDEELLQDTVFAPEGESVFFGVSCVEATIRRINVGGPGGELVDDIQTWSETPVDCPWDCGNGDGVVDVVDFLALLAQWGEPGSCDFDGDGVGVTDFLEMLAGWGPCPGNEL